MTLLKSRRGFNRLYWLIPMLAAPILLLGALATTVSSSRLSVKPFLPQQRHRTNAYPNPMVTRSSSPAIAPTQTEPKQLAQTQPSAEMLINVAIATKSNILPVATSTVGLLKNDEGKGLRSLPAGATFYLQPAGEKINFGSWKSPQSVWIEPTAGGYVFVGNHWYRGKVRVISQGNSLLAVNQVKLEEYLYSVVGSEMWSNWPLEALKAQAIAARSYAIARFIDPASPLYQLGATEAWQAYKGLDGEADTTHAAVEQTAGKILTSNGAIVDAWYASTDEVSAKAHGGRGMSQEGAKDLAKQGQDYQSILQNYYPGTTIFNLQPPSNTKLPPPT